MAKKFVMYNGETARYYPCTDPIQLVKGKVYEVVSEKVSAFHTEYKLEGISGEFNSCWFNDIDEYFPTYFAYAYKEPVVGEVFSDFFRYIDNNIQPVKKTSPVQYVEKVAKDVYKMYTAHTIYFVQIKKQVN